MHHDIQARKAADTILNNWRTEVWKNPLITKGVHMTKTETSFPSPDGCFYEPIAESRIAIEFKPSERESQRGILTGLGQSISYLNRHGASYLVIPNEVPDNHKIGDYLEETFKRSIYGRIPVGLITYNDHDFDNLFLRCDIDPRLELEQGRARGSDENYWAAWRDTPPHSIYLLLKECDALTDDNDRSDKIWKRYYFTDYVVMGALNTLNDIPSRIKMWDGVTSQVPLEGIKRELRERITNGEISNERALEVLKEKTDPSGIDNNFRNIKKNHYNFVNHLSLWDVEFRLTKYGKRLIQIGDEHGGESEEFRDAIAYLMLDIGRHAELIEDMKKALLSTDVILSSIGDVRSVAYDFMEAKGYIKKNPNRTTTGVREVFSSEFGVWHHIGVLNKPNNSYFTENGGLSFNDEKIKQILSKEKEFEFSKS